RSVDNALVMGCWPPPSQQLESEISPSRNPQSDSVYDDHALKALKRHNRLKALNVLKSARPRRLSAA
ncbi:hypothetical protein, partial [Falsiroseomonas ponticola]|uniref:hypothetical protein n=1 Tax=Falsiroseomonas ponticola TaxID=2786951 RepID=UPI001CF78194